MNHVIGKSVHDVSMEKYVFIFRGLGHAVAQLVETLRYKPEGRGFDGVIKIFH
jgi:hypothetical protein